MQHEMPDFVGDGKPQTVFEAWTYEGAFVHEDGFQIAHEQSVDVQLLAQAVHGNEVEMQVEFGKVEDFNGQFASCRICGAQPVGLLPDTFFGIVWRFEFARVVQGWLALLMSSKQSFQVLARGFLA